jgi:hypothetical protein
MGFSKIKGPLTSRVGQSVRFGSPKDVGTDASFGKIIDEVWEDPEVNVSPRRRRTKGDWGDYSFCAQLIEWATGERQIRLAYYRRRAGEDHWEFASQMTVCSEPERIKRLCEATFSKRSWFK